MFLHCFEERHYNASQKYTSALQAQTISNVPKQCNACVHFGCECVLLCCLYAEWNHLCLPLCSACLMRNRAARSFTEPPGLRCSAFTRMLQLVSSLMRFSFISGVLQGENREQCNTYKRCKCHQDRQLHTLSASRMLPKTSSTSSPAKQP